MAIEKDIRNIHDISLTHFGTVHVDHILLLTTNDELFVIFFLIVANNDKTYCTLAKCIKRKRDAKCCIQKKSVIRQE